MKCTVLMASIALCLSVALSCKDEDTNKPAGSAGGSNVVAEKVSPAIPTTSPAASIAPWRTLDTSMDAFFAGVTSKPAQAAAPVQLNDLVGEWSATITRFEVDADPSGLAGSAADIPGFTFVIRNEGGTFLLAPADGKGTPRTLSATPAGIVAAGTDGRPEMQLKYSNGELDGVMPLLTPVRGKVEFHAIRNR